MTSYPFFRFAKQVLQEMLQGNFSIINNLKYFSRWKTALQPDKNSVTDEQPWITFQVITFLKLKIKPTSKIFEYGCGGSTLFFVKKAMEVVTVEHDQEWFTKLQQKLGHKLVTTWKGDLILPEQKAPGISLDASNPDHYYTNDPNFVDNTFIHYATYVDRFPDEYFDFILVDGRSRPSCIFHSVAKIKKGGYLIVDNSDRTYYFKLLKDCFRNNFKLILNNRAPSPYADFFTQTGVWQKL